MSTPRKNPTIGQIGCWTPGCGHVAAVRRDGRGRFYAVCVECGRHAHEGQLAQDVIADNAEIWGEQGDPPAHAPRWIAEDWGHAHTIRNIQRAREPVGGAPEKAEDERATAAPAAETVPVQDQAPMETPRAPTGAPSVVPPPDDPPSAPLPPDPPAADPEPQEPPTAAELEGDDEDEEDPDDWP